MVIDLFFNLFLIYYLSIGTGLFFNKSFNFITPQVGFSLLTILSSVILFLNPINGTLVPKILLILIFLFSSFGIYKNREALLNNKKNYFYLIITITITLTSIFLLTGNDSLRFHMSPDNHGFGATFSYFHENFSFQSLVSEFKNITELDKAVHLGQPTPIFNSVWNIPDSRLRFTADMIFTVGRLGLPALMSVVSSFQEPSSAFLTIMIVLGIYVLTFISINIVEISSKLIKSNKGKEKIPFYLKVFASLIISISPVFVIYILQGALTQFFLLYFLTILLVSIIQYSINPNLINSILINLVCFAGILVYPNGVVLLSVVLVVSNLIYLKTDLIRVSISALIFMFFGVFLLLGDTFIPMMKQFLSGVSGVPYQLAFNSIPELLSWNLIDYEISSYNSANIFGISGTVLRKPFFITSSNIIFAFGSIIIFYFFIPIRNSFESLKIRNILFLLVLISSIPILKNIGKDSLHPYIYLRDISLEIIWLYPIVTAIFLKLFLKIKNKLILKIIIITLITLSLHKTYSTFAKFKLSSRPFLCLNKTEIENVSKNSNSTIYVSKKPNHSYLALSLFGKFYYLTDDWQPTFIPKQFEGEYEVKEITGESCAEDIYKVGQMEFNKEIKGPINSIQIKDLIK